MPNWEQLLDRPIPAAGETPFGCEYSVVSILVGCEEEDGATHLSMVVRVPCVLMGCLSTSVIPDGGHDPPH